VTDPIPYAVGRGGLVVVLSPDRLHAACVARGWSLSELAVRARVSRPTLRSALGGRPVRPRTAWKLARALNGAAAEPDLLEILAAS
jgi:transcriptional regulator with XRE-family HTH domain